MAKKNKLAKKKKKELVTLNMKVQTVFKHLEAKSPDGKVSPQDIVEASKNPSSPLHSRFEWDDTRAGERYRVWQARQMLSTITIEVGQVETKAFQNIVVEVEEGKERGYYSIDRVLNDSDLRQRVLIQMAQHLRSTIKRYEEYKVIYKLIDVNELKKLEKKINTQPVSP